MSTKFTNLFGRKNNIRFADFLYDHCNKSKRGAAYVRRYRRFARLIEAYEQSVRREIYTDSFSDEITEEFIHFIRSSTPIKKGHSAYRQSTIKQFINQTASALHKAGRKGYKVDLEAIKNFKLLKEDHKVVYLSMSEIEKLNAMPLRGERSQVRDIFLIGCCTALRYSDYSKLSEDNFHGGCIQILTKKTNTQVTIPIHYIVKDIINRNGGYGFLKYRKSPQNFNEMIKRICRDAGIVDKILIERIEGFKKICKIYKKYELISSHTARRSGATNMYLAGIPVFRIMLITGHKTQDSFFLYIGIGKEENAKELQDHEFFRGNLKFAGS